MNLTQYYWRFSAILIFFNIPLADHVSWEKCSKTRRKANVTPIFKEKSGNYRPVDLTFITRKVMEELILETIFRHVKDKKVSSSQRGFTRASHAWSVWWICEITDLVDNQGVVDNVCVDFSKAFNTVSNNRPSNSDFSIHLRIQCRGWCSVAQSLVGLQYLAGYPKGSVLGPVLFNNLH